jgi:hypothetical protein
MKEKGYWIGFAIESFLWFLMIFTAVWTGLWFYENLDAEEVIIRLHEGTAEWIAVDAIENDNIILKKKLDDLQTHYDSMVCYRPSNTIHE